MRKLPLMLAASLFVLTSPAQSTHRQDGEARLARAVEGRVAGEPVDCIQLHQVRSSTIIDNEAILFDAGATIYVNRPRAGRESLDHWDTLLTRPFGSRLCSIDVVRLLDATSRMETGTVFLGEFVPYTRKRTGR
ncbi:MAG TPA: hypothetical protein VEW25_01625 [Allosphingosinicella sp.]|nr:hypothetical protein [Allosphingosinicella sp.]